MACSPSTSAMPTAAMAIRWADRAGRAAVAVCSSRSQRDVIQLPPRLVYSVSYHVYIVRMRIRRTQRSLLTFGMAGPVTFVAAYLVNGATQPGYSSWHDTISALSLAGHGWIQVANFML